MLLLKFNKNSLSSSFKNNLLPIISDARLTNGKKSKGYPMFSNLISFRFSKDFIWSKKLVPAIIGQNCDLTALLFKLIKFKFSNWYSFFFF